MLRFFPFLGMFLLLLGCSNNKEYHVYLQPYNDFTIREVTALKTDIQNCFDSLIPEITVIIHILEQDTLPKEYLNSSKSRYRADSIIRNQQYYTGYVLGVTHSDISCSVHGISDYGVLGLSTVKGHSAAISDYRVHDKSLLYKVGVHELLHCFGLNHCPNNDRNCYICDANKKPQLEKQTFLCLTCKKKLLNKE